MNYIYLQLPPFLGLLYFNYGSHALHMTIKKIHTFTVSLNYHQISCNYCRTNIKDRELRISSYEKRKKEQREGECVGAREKEYRIGTVDDDDGDDDVTVT